MHQPRHRCPAYITTSMCPVTVSDPCRTQAEMRTPLFSCDFDSGRIVPRANLLGQGCQPPGGCSAPDPVSPQPGTHPLPPGSSLASISPVLVRHPTQDRWHGDHSIRGCSFVPGLLPNDRPTHPRGTGWNLLPPFPGASSIPVSEEAGDSSSITVAVWQDDQPRKLRPIGSNDGTTHVLHYGDATTRTGIQCGTPFSSDPPRALEGRPAPGRQHGACSRYWKRGYARS